MILVLFVSLLQLTFLWLAKFDKTKEDTSGRNREVQ
jgi:hypothetical protein